MKNIYLVSSDIPVRYYGNHYINQNVYITSDEEIKDGDYYIYIKDGSLRQYKKEFNPSAASASYNKKIILTTDQDLISDGVQAIDDDFLEWFVKNPSCEFVEVEKIRVISYSFPRNAYDKYRITIPKEESKFEDSIENSVNIMSIANSMFGKKEEPKQETIDEASSRLLYSKYPFHPPQDSGYWKDMFLEGVKWLEQRMYSKEDLMEFFIEGYKQRAESSNMIFDDASRLYAIHLFNEQIKKK